MGTQRLSAWCGEVNDFLELNDKMTLEAGEVLQGLSSKLREFSRETANIRSRATTLTAASINIRKVRTRYDELLASLDMSRKQGGVISRGPAGEHLGAFLDAVKDLKGAVEVLENHRHLACIRNALTHARQVFFEGMHECESNFATTLSECSLQIAKDDLIKGGTSVELVSPEALPRLRVLADTMLEGEHDGFSRVYVDIRSQGMEAIFSDMGLREYNWIFLQTLSFENFEQKVQEWIKILQALVGVLSEEKKIAQAVFTESNATKIFAMVIDRTMELVVQMGREVAATKNAHEKLFSLFNMHLHLETIIKPMHDILHDTAGGRYVADLKKLMGDITVAANQIFKEYQEFVATDNSKKEGSDGTVHPLCASVMTYLKKLLKHDNFLRVLYRIVDKDGLAQFSVGNPMSAALVHILMVLQGNLETKSKLYKSKALASLFMMNNIHFMIRSVEQSKAAFLLGDLWLDRHRHVMKSYCQQYYEITWEPIVKILTQYVDDMNISSAPKRCSALKDRFRAFNKAFGEVSDTQCQWIIPDGNLRLTVTKKITSTLIPSYHKFIKEMEAANFTKNPEKYFKYTVNQVQQVVNDDLFQNKYFK